MSSDRLDTLLTALASQAPASATDGVLREAAVALILVGDPDRILLIRRAEHAGDPWSGHLAFPGGRREADDADLLDTAIRETMEETGIVLVRAQCRAVLSDLAPVSLVLPPLVVRPHVFLLSAGVTPVLNREVAGAAWVELDHLLRPGVFRERTLAVGGRSRSVGGYQLEQGFLWGMTERMLTPVLRQWVAIAAPLTG